MEWMKRGGGPLWFGDRTLEKEVVMRAGHSCEACGVSEGREVYVNKVQSDYLPRWYEDAMIAEMDDYILASVFGTMTPVKSNVALVVVTDGISDDNADALYVLCHNCARMSHSVVGGLQKTRKRAVKAKATADENVEGYAMSLFGD
jgi:hypothetical protein